MEVHAFIIVLLAGNVIIFFPTLLWNIISGKGSPWALIGLITILWNMSMGIAYLVMYPSCPEKYDARATYSCNKKYL